VEDQGSWRYPTSWLSSPRKGGGKSGSPDTIDPPRLTTTGRPWPATHETTPKQCPRSPL
jgi:hypothetical protein